LKISFPLSRPRHFSRARYDFLFVRLSFQFF
jgi:hypothetical protein